MSVIDLKNVQKSFGGKKIFSNFSLSIENKEMVALVGESGCGKTTLLNMMGLIEPVDDGTLSILGERAVRPNTTKSNKIIREDICYLFQNFALISNETVLENLIMALRYKKISKKEKIQLIKTALHEVDLSGYEKTKAYSLSGGEQQRVAMARILVNPKKIILADEPTGSLDAKNRDQILLYLKKLNNKGVTVVIVTHDPIVAQQCSRIIDLSK